MDKLKQLLIDISNKNENLNKDNVDLNKNVLSLITLLKAKDTQLKQMIIEILFKKKEIQSKVYLRNAFNQLRYHHIQKLQNSRNVLKIEKIEKMCLNEGRKDNIKKNRFFIRYEETINYKGKQKTNYISEELVEDFSLISYWKKEEEDEKGKKQKYQKPLKQQYDQSQQKPQQYKNRQLQIQQHQLQIQQNQKQQYQQLEIQQYMPQHKKIDLKYHRQHQFYIQGYRSNNIKNALTQTEDKSKKTIVNYTIVFKETDIHYLNKSKSKPIINKIHNWNNNNLKIQSPFKNQFISSSKIPQETKPIINQICSWNNNNLKIQSPFKNQFTSSPKIPQETKQNSFAYLSKTTSSLSLLTNKLQSKPKNNIFNSCSISTLIPVMYINNPKNKSIPKAKVVLSTLNYFYNKRISHFLTRLKYKTLSIQMLFGMKICKQILITTKLKGVFKASNQRLLHSSFHHFHNKGYLNHITEKDDKINQLALLSNGQQEELSELHNANNLLKSQMTKFQSTFSQYEQSFKLKIEQIEGKYSSTITQLKKELKEKSDQYDKLKKMSSDSAIEIINSSNSCTQQLLEIKQLTSDNKELVKNVQSLSTQLSSKEQLLSKLNVQIQTLKKEIDANESKQSNESKNNKVKITNYQTQIEGKETQITNLLKENKKLQAAIEELSETNEHFEKMLNESKGAKNENFSLREKVSQYENSNKSMALKYNKLKEEYDDLKLLSEESKTDLANALQEMQGYSSLLQLMQQKMEDSEQAKLAAENERDTAKNEIKTIRQRYINIIGESKMK